jgi:hypothetical protein
MVVVAGVNTPQTRMFAVLFFDGCPAGAYVAVTVHCRLVLASALLTALNVPLLAPAAHAAGSVPLIVQTVFTKGKL